MDLFNDCKECHTLEDCTIDLKNKALWQQFHELETEMIITKSGRRMFPSLQVQISNLDPHAQYCIYLEFTPVGHCRYKYSGSGGWAPAGAEESQSPQRIYYHPESPATGDYWMSQAISFGRVKLTNTQAPPAGHVVLSSMHKYQPKVIIVKTSDPRCFGWVSSKVVAFPETQFVAVTAYQNEKITKLKIDHNPFAKGFRENGQSKCKRKRLVEEKTVEREAKQPKVEIPQRSPQSDDDRVSVISSQCSSDASSSADSQICPYPYKYNPMLPIPIHPYSRYYVYPQYSGVVWGSRSQFIYQPGLASPLQVFEPLKTPTKLTDFSIDAIMRC